MDKYTKQWLMIFVTIIALVAAFFVFYGVFSISEKAKMEIRK